ncbi:unnamed protein product [Wuchereria bancrofti]|uniref:Uncharacterized protein n=1 Tax=Wuchereria bancrofti TaxID=6293 RepID=A0A3P7FDE4_WUCBA|nr:unnamed protein product [Wuchereria bancrofti]
MSRAIYWHSRNHKYKMDPMHSIGFNIEETTKRRQIRLNSDDQKGILNLINEETNPNNVLPNSQSTPITIVYIQWRGIWSSFDCYQGMNWNKNYRIKYCIHRRIKYCIHREVKVITIN